MTDIEQMRAEEELWGDTTSKERKKKVKPRKASKRLRDKEALDSFRTQPVQKSRPAKQKTEKCKYDFSGTSI